METSSDFELLGSSVGVPGGFRIGSRIFLRVFLGAPQAEIGFLRGSATAQTRLRHCQLSKLVIYMDYTACRLLVSVSERFV